MSDTINNKPDITIDPKEYKAAIRAATRSVDLNTYTHHFKRPFKFVSGAEERTVDDLTFDFGSLTGRDSLNIEAELQSLGKPVVVAEMSGEYLIRMAARACTEKIGADSLANMPLSDFNRIRGRARSFLLHSEL